MITFCTGCTAFGSKGRVLSTQALLLRVTVLVLIRSLLKDMVRSSYLEVSLSRLGFSFCHLELLLLLVKPRLELEQLRRHVNAPLLNVCVCFGPGNVGTACTVRPRPTWKKGLI